MKYRDILGIPKNEKKKIIKEEPEDSVADTLKEEFGPLHVSHGPVAAAFGNKNQNTKTYTGPKRWSGSGLTEFERKGGKDNVNEKMGFDEKQYVERIAGHYQTGIILMKMAQQMDKENRTETQHKQLHMDLSKYLKNLKKRFDL